ncbi:MAG TPA: alpha-ribazole phosphatase family protein [Puia sp.]|nr:alpha-ribazole phosphatase family protein [Puia sp.]
MKDIYLIRHTTPAVEKGICYGQTDLDVTESFREEAELIRRSLPARFTAVYSSPLQRCTRLASHLFPGVPLTLRPQLMELHCGAWEMRAWDSLPKEEIDPWMEDFVHMRVPGGESYTDLYRRVMQCWEEIAGGVAQPDTPGARARCDDDVEESIAVVAHGGVIRSILAGVTGTSLADSFKAFSLHYGCVVRMRPHPEKGHLVHETLWNRTPAEKEQHKPASFYKKFM